MTASPEWICECGWVMRRIPIPAVESYDKIQPARYVLTCRNQGCEHRGKQWKEPDVRVVRLHPDTPPPPQTLPQRNRSTGPDGVDTPDSAERDSVARKTRSVCHD